MNEKIKILHITESSGWSGGAAQALLLAGELRSAGHDNIFSCPADGELGRKAASAGFEVHNMRPRRDYDLATAFALSRLIDKLSPDVLHAHHPKAHAMGLLAKVMARRNPVFIVTRRVSHPIITTFFARRKYCNDVIDGFIAVAESVRRILSEYGIPPKKIRTIYSGTDPDRFSPRPPDPAITAELRLRPGLPVIMLVGNFSQHKGQHVLIDAAARLRAKGLEFSLVFAGRGTESEQLRALCSARGLPEDITRFLGLRSDVERLLSTASVSVNAAVKGEALSGSIRESLAMGIPAVASDISGNSEIVRHGVNGFLFPPGDAAALATHLETLMKDLSCREKFSRNSVDTVRAGFTADIMGKRTLQYYNELLRAA